MVLTIFIRLAVTADSQEATPIQRVEGVTLLVWLRPGGREIRDGRVAGEFAPLDDSRFRNRMLTTPAAVRELSRFGLAALGIDAAAGVTSSDSGL